MKDTLSNKSFLDLSFNKFSEPLTKRDFFIKKILIMIRRIFKLFMDI